MFLRNFLTLKIPSALCKTNETCHYLSLTVEYSNILSLNFNWFFALLYCRDVDLTEKLDYSSAVVLLGFSLILAILRSFNIRDEATRVMVAAPLIAFVTTHVMYINFYKLDYGMSLILYLYIVIVEAWI